MQASPPAVPERFATASCQSKWAGPRVSALGTALVTAPFLIWVDQGRRGSGRPTVHGTIHPGAGPVSVTQTKIDAADGLAHPSKAIAAMSKKPKAAAAM